MGVVYAAHDQRLQRMVALKTLSAMGNDPNAHQRFWREARAAASVNHPNVCQLLVDERGWTWEQWERWFLDAARAQLLQERKDGGRQRR